ncbi:hypothetical protein APSETT445_003455 [Aspergillus pseudonomiae]
MPLNGGQGISGQLGAGTQPQTGNIEEFPPLGRNVAAEIGQDRRGSLMQSAGFGSYNAGLPLSGASQAQATQNRNAVLERHDRPSTKPPMGCRVKRKRFGPQYEGCMYTGLRYFAQDLNNAVLSTQRNFTEQQSASGETQETSGAAQSAEQPPLGEMSELDKFGLAGLLRMIHSDSPDVAALAVGQDLMTLGLDLNQPEPLHTSFASPFVASMTGVPLEQDFALPSCYNVANIQPLQSRIASFSDETLFYIFYSMPRDIMQEVVAEELMGRKWRYHKIERCWLTRDETYPGPVDVERGVSERGIYLIWDPATWKKIRVR